MSSTGSNRHRKADAPRNGSIGLRRGDMPGHLSFLIDSDLDQGREVQKQILAAVSEHGFSGQNYFAITLAIEEAITNAIKHGNRLDKKKKVRIEARISTKQFEIEIEDEGVGFDRTKVPDPTSVENLEKCSGRGILLIEAYMNRVSWDHGGRRVRMLKLNEPE